MKNLVFTTIMTMGMCMQTCCMRMISCAKTPDMFSNRIAKRLTA